MTGTKLETTDFEIVNFKKVHFFANAADLYVDSDTLTEVIIC
jgi:hypothetical protein